MSEASTASALAHRPDRAGPDGLSISMREIAGRGMIDVRGSATSTKFRQAVRQATGCDLPVRPRTSANAGDVAILWLSVDQWLVCCNGDRTAAISQALIATLAGQHSLVVDVSDARSIIRLEGELVREVLMKGTSLDFLPPAMPAGSVRRMLFAEIAALAHVVDDQPDIIDIYVFRSYADYCWKWLLATGRSGSEVRLFAARG